MNESTLTGVSLPEIRQVLPSDASAVIELYLESVRDPVRSLDCVEIIDKWEPSFQDPVSFAARISKDIEVGFVAIDEGGRIVGFSSIMPSFNRLCAVYVHPSAVQTGLSQALVIAAERRAIDSDIDDLYLDASPGAEDFYLNMGYVVVQKDETDTKSILMKKILQHNVGYGRR
jgi:N-acetylglutamate synthase-like GNAT family acetyltransferase